MNDELEGRLGAYGTTLEVATATDLAERDDHVVDTIIESSVRRPNRTVRVLVLLAVAGAAALALLALAGLPGSRDANNRPASTVPASESDSGADGNPTPAQAARLAQEVLEYPKSVVAQMIRQAHAHHEQIDNQAIVAALEFQNACIQTRRAATAAESAPPHQVASVVHDIMRPEITRLIQRTPSGSSSYQGFQELTDRIIGGQASAILQDMGKDICTYMSLNGPKLPGSKPPS